MRGQIVTVVRGVVFWVGHSGQASRKVSLELKPKEHKGMRE